MPKPTAEPAVAAIAPSRVAKPARELFKSFMIFLQIVIQAAKLVKIFKKPTIKCQQFIIRPINIRPAIQIHAPNMDYLPHRIILINFAI